jgi:hypothetical protein
LPAGDDVESTDVARVLLNHPVVTHPVHPLGAPTPVWLRGVRRVARGQLRSSSTSRNVCTNFGALCSAARQWIRGDRSRPGRRSISAPEAATTHWHSPAGRWT